MNKKYIILVSQFLNGGVENLFISIAQKTPQNFYYLISLRNNIDENQVKKLPENVKFIDCKFNFLFLRFFFFLNKSIFMLRQCEVIIDFHEMLIDELFIILLKPFKECWHWFNTNPLMRKGRRFFKLYYFLFRIFDRVICICDMQKNVLCSLSKAIRKMDIRISYNFIDKDRVISLSKEQNDYCAEKYIMTIARVDFGAKDFMTLIEGYENITSPFEDYKLMIVGDGPDMDQLKARIDISPKKDKIILTGKQSNPYKYLKDAKVFVLSSRTEGFPLVILEAMALGVPVVVSDCLCGSKEIVNVDEYGLVFDIGDSIMLTDKILSILNDNKLYNLLSENGIKRCEYYISESENSIKKLLL